MIESERQKRRAKTMDNGAGGAIGLIKPVTAKKKKLDNQPKNRK